MKRGRIAALLAAPAPLDPATVDDAELASAASSADLVAALSLLASESASLPAVGVHLPRGIALGSQLSEILGKGGAWLATARAAAEDWAHGEALVLLAAPLPPPANVAIVRAGELEATALATLSAAKAPQIVMKTYSLLLRTSTIRAGARFSADDLAATVARAGSESGCSGSSSKSVPHVSVAPASVIAVLLRAGLITGAGGGGEAGAGSALYLLSLPGGGKLWAAVSAGRAALVARVRRRAYAEMPQVEAEQRALAGTPLPPRFHARDAVGAGVLSSVRVASRGGAATLRIP